MPWKRETPWHQGSVLNSRDFACIGLGEAKNRVSVAISHDCDITQEDLRVEPHVEFIIGRCIEEVDGNHTYAKNPRTLHFTIKHKTNNVHIELLAVEKIRISKDDLCGMKPDTDWHIGDDALWILQNWLATRYKRQSLPDALVKRLRPATELLQKLGKQHSHDVLGYWLDYEPFSMELPLDQPYEIWMYVVYNTDNKDAEIKAKKIAGSLKKKLQSLESDKILLQNCEVYSEEEFTLRDLRSNIHFRLDHISLNPKFSGPVVQ
ncbi:MAG: hypothetical protein F4X92_00630 [Gammaproteobacteria bacterium]|nr:hypothetical protein [Gammaproteobacteria bacterium]